MCVCVCVCVCVYIYMDFGLRSDEQEDVRNEHKILIGKTRIMDITSETQTLHGMVTN